MGGVSVENAVINFSGDDMGLTKSFRIILLSCGILSSLLYIGTDVLASCLYEGYSYTSQQISELSAIGAPTSRLWISMSFIWALLIIAFGFGTVTLSHPKRFLRLTGILMTIYGATGLLWNLAPMHQRGTAELLDDIMHIVFAGIQVSLIFLFIMFGSGADGTGFRIYSFFTLIVLLAFGTWTSSQIPAIAEGMPTPWLGIAERVSVYAPMLWVIILAVVLLRSEIGQHAEHIVTKEMTFS